MKNIMFRKSFKMLGIIADLTCHTAPLTTLRFDHPRPDRIQLKLALTARSVITEFCFCFRNNAPCGSYDNPGDEQADHDVGDRLTKPHDQSGRQ